MKHKILGLACLLNLSYAIAQEKNVMIESEGRQVTLSPVVVRSGTNVPGFIKRVEQDTTFYKAFKNYTGFTPEKYKKAQLFKKHLK